MFCTEDWHLIQFFFLHKLDWFSGLLYFLQTFSNIHVWSSDSLSDGAMAHQELVDVLHYLKRLESGDVEEREARAATFSQLSSSQQGTLLIKLWETLMAFSSNCAAVKQCLLGGSNLTFFLRALRMAMQGGNARWSDEDSKESAPIRSETSSKSPTADTAVLSNEEDSIATFLVQLLHPSQSSLTLAVADTAHLDLALSSIKKRQLSILVELVARRHKQQLEGYKWGFLSVLARSHLFLFPAFTCSNLPTFVLFRSSLHSSSESGSSFSTADTSEGKQSNGFERSSPKVDATDVLFALCEVDADLVSGWYRLYPRCSATRLQCWSFLYFYYLLFNFLSLTFVSTGSLSFLFPYAIKRDRLLSCGGPVGGHWRSNSFFPSLFYMFLLGNQRYQHFLEKSNPSNASASGLYSAFWAANEFWVRTRDGSFFFMFVLFLYAILELLF